MWNPCKNSKVNPEQNLKKNCLINYFKRNKIEPSGGSKMSVQNQYQNDSKSLILFV